MEALKNPRLHMKNKDYVDLMCAQFTMDGPSRLQVISDFDFTLTVKPLDGKKCTSTYGTLEEGPFGTDEFKKRSALLFNRYHLIEIDPDISKADKEKFMKEWYAKSVLLLPMSGISKDSIPEMVETSNICLREGCDNVFTMLYSKLVPFLIFSAGVGDILEQKLKSTNLYFPNIKVIANFLRFDEKDKIIGFQDELICSYSKKEASIKNRDYFEGLSRRNNIILLGDSLGDLDMTAGVSHSNFILKIGFLNEKVEESLQEYMNKFDIVVTDDDTMDVMLLLLDGIFRGY